MKDKIINAAKAVGVELDDKKAQQLLDYYHLLIEWNEKMNLTAITDFDEVTEKHFADSLSCIKTGVFEGQNKTVIDVGCGAGFPSIPLKIALPELDFTLVDSLNKRVTFLNCVIERLGLTGIKTVHARAEDSGRSSLRDSFDVCVARAVASLPTLCELCLPHVKAGGYFVAMKGKDAQDEIKLSDNALKQLGGRLESVTDSGIPGLSHSNIVIKKLSETNKKYPRKAGTPSKKPL